MRSRGIVPPAPVRVGTHTVRAIECTVDGPDVESTAKLNESCAAAGEMAPWSRSELHMVIEGVAR